MTEGENSIGGLFEASVETSHGFGRGPKEDTTGDSLSRDFYTVLVRN